jgi:hypothetical protein
MQEKRGTERRINVAIQHAYKKEKGDDWGKQCHRRMQREKHPQAAEKNAVILPAVQ